MADIYQAIKTRLEAASGLTAFVGTRIYPHVLPQNPTMPAVVYELISNEREERHRGQTGDARPRVQVTTWANTALGAANAANEVRLAVMAMDGTVASVDVHGVWNAGESRGFEPDTGRHFAAMDFFIAYKEAVA